MYDEFIKKLVNWANAQDGIIALALVGSRARGTARLDSDIDLVIIADDYNKFLNNGEWVDFFGGHKEIKKEDWGLLKSIRVKYDSGLEVEYGFSSLEWAKTNPVDPGTRKVVSDGMNILLDKQGVLLSLNKTVLQ